MQGVTATSIRKDGSGVDCDVKVSLQTHGVTLESIATSTSKVNALVERLRTLSERSALCSFGTEFSRKEQDLWLCIPGIAE